MLVYLHSLSKFHPLNSVFSVSILCYCRCWLGYLFLILTSLFYWCLCFFFLSCTTLFLWLPLGQNHHKIIAMNWQFAIDCA